MTPAGGHWSAPHHPTPVHATIRVPGSKSHTARALVLAALANAPTTIRGALDSRDTTLMARALTSLGAGVERDGDVWRVAPLDPAAMEPTTVECGLAGTVMRFVAALAATGACPIRFTGDEAALARPMGPLLDALSSMGVRVEYEGDAGHLPFTVTGPARVPASATVRVDASASSQFLSALLLASPLLADPLRIEADGNVVSMPHVRLTVEAMRERGLDVTDAGPGRWLVRPGRAAGESVDIEPDLTNAGVFLAAAHLTGGTVRIPDWPRATAQAGDAWRDLFTRLGARLRWVEGALELTGPGVGTYDGLDIDMSDHGELVPTLAAVLLHARTPSHLRGIAHLRGHETDRLAALVDQIHALGGGAREKADGLVIIPTPLHGAALEARQDHRLATFAALVALVVPGVQLDDVGATSKTLPGFTRLWEMCVSGHRGT
ncbi:3-phosphoshikimate 1-carboxyvinyltransferase [Schaalia sp. 19OD2882]|uniref:3-phosphoshikimate 1-carboxyvinyltransferase n=1 Tax=Schaalia sp. 19OD2882 TaxID=2794089 RepID=UPI001C1EDF20|nr:3-phosphoshikimate 1-carboxyvinyltransferase [Schaalia sp. 19OD2882]QWW20322.1 3-phosphoshikimate 1-carboxyvinyltransferase [Schaalia sp. 19OD2882]